ncbi:MAG: zinc ABC transporter substrate-binding protein [Prevotellaceae bacterium]|nr:zinc ABC transporter substrate-binding protein [Prevotellaceae bacterium]MDY5210235.1 zinc ABC transporter substrate-binding protein [Prevotella sp.]
MDSIIAFLMNWGYMGMALSAFLAASILPFSSEAVMVGLLAAGLDMWALVAWGTVGNVLGSLFNYGIGRLGKMEWIEKYLHTKPEDLDRARRFMGGRGAWMGLFSCIPVIGDVITIVLGLMRANLTIFIVSVTISKLARYVVLMVTAGTLFSCSSAKNDNANKITVSIEPLRYLTEQIVGDRFEVVTMVPKGSSPETYEPTARQMADLSESILYIKVGELGFERTWMPRLTSNAPHITVVNSSEGITSHIGDDPHSWMSARNAIIMAHNIYEAVKRIDVKDSVLFRQRLDSLCNVIHATDKYIRQTTAQAHCKSFIIYHPALTYFASDYGLEQLALEEHGREPSAAELEQIISTARAKGVKTMFVQREFANRNVDIITNTIGARKVEINPLGYDWNKEMRRIAAEMTN